MPSGHHLRRMLPLHIQVTRVRATSTLNSMAGVLSTISSIPQEAISREIGLCTLLMVQRVTGRLITKPLVVLKVVHRELRAPIPTGISPQVTNPGQGTLKHLLQVQERLSHQAKVGIIIVLTEDILTLANRGLLCMLGGLTTPSTEASTLPREVHNPTHNSGVNRPDRVLLQTARLVRGHGHNHPTSHHTNHLKILNSLGDPTCLLQV